MRKFESFASDKEFKNARAMIPVRNLMATTFVTRACPLHCTYCNITKSPMFRRVLTKQWPDVMRTLDMLGYGFNLILGNEPTLLGNHLIDLVSYMKGGTAYALYTIFPEQWDTLKYDLVKAGLQNVSCGVDYPYDYSFSDKSDRTEVEKSRRAYNEIRWARDMGVPGAQATATITQDNVYLLGETAHDVTEVGAWYACNPIHWDVDFDVTKVKDPFGFDFFPTRNEVKSLIFEYSDRVIIENGIARLREARKNGAKVFNEDEQYDDYIEFVPQGNNWHCTRPNLMVVDPDGYFRCCAYRRGKRTNKLSIFDLAADPERTIQLWMDAWYKDMYECSGCMWSMWNSAERHDERGEQESIDYYGAHGNELFDQDDWDPVDATMQAQGGFDGYETGFGVDRVLKSGDWEKRVKKQVQNVIMTKPYCHDTSLLARMMDDDIDFLDPSDLLEDIFEILQQDGIAEGPDGLE